MKRKEEILQDIERLKAASPSDGLSLFAQLEEAVNAYFTPQEKFENLICECAYQMAFNYEYRHTTFVNQEPMHKFSENYPKGYEDLRELFDGDGVWEEIEKMPETTFAAAFQRFVPEVSDSDTGGAKMINPYINEWTARVLASREGIIPALTEINDFCELDANNQGLSVYFEEHGGIASAPTHKEIAERVFSSGGYAEVIRAFNLSNVHIPTYIDN
ncbi:MAG: hypothetical protein J6M62_04500 [Selenomonadaceae bacterium]|nr:hypothetical protein [Selenomonadaceae bacterium]MBP3722297.1 hypothetical protein [Selenomonadaceae bacterium]